VIIAAGVPSESQITTEPTLRSRMSWATLSTLSSSPAVTTPVVMMSRSFIGGYRNRLTVTEVTKAAEQFEPSSRAGEDEPPRGTVPVATGAIGVCPACGGPLYGWTEARPADARRGENYVLDRCEACGLGILREGELDVPGLLAAGRLRDDGTVEIAVPNRRSLQATIGEGRWAALRLPEVQAAFTPRALTAALTRRGHRVTRMRQPLFGSNQLWMWQTLMSAITLHPNFLREWLAGRLTPSSGRGGAAFALDVVVSFLAAPLVALVSVPMELVSALARRGGLLVARVSPGSGQGED
jgi:hypothetical protein